MWQIKTNLKFTIHNLQFTMAFYPAPFILHPVPRSVGFDGLNHRAYHSSFTLHPKPFTLATSISPIFFVIPLIVPSEFEIG
jgi:hypothetical protein